jgi:hypothetical protein
MNAMLIWLLVILSFLLGWEWKKAIDGFKKEARKQAEEQARQDDVRPSLEEAHRRWDASLEAIEELFEK